MEQAWKHVLATLRRRVDSADYDGLIARLHPLAQQDRNFLFEAPNRLAIAVITQRYVGVIEEVLSAEVGRPVRVILQPPNAMQQELFPLVDLPPEPEAVVVPKRPASLIPKYTFANFVVGASNQFAHAASKAVAGQPGVHYNPLFIYGGVGLGKTHLVNAIGFEIFERSQNARVVYLSSESFMNELIGALRRDRMDEFKGRFRRVDVLILDDVQFLAGRERTQEEFFHTFNSLYEGHRQIVLTSDKFPKEIPDLEERLRNRFEWGLIADIQPPDVETRVAILEKKAEVEHIELPSDVAMFLASNISSNVRELEGSLTRLGAFASLNKCAITVDFAREVLHTILREHDRVITIESIQKAICEFYNLRPSELRSKKRTKNVALPRQVAMYLCRRHTSASFPVIGDRFGGRDHSTVIHATNTVDRRMREDASFRATVERIERLIENVA
ncbi:MAG: chromosomal replication initiator protein DnaA [Deltaproteobacteria bacterium]|nr:chromosomal replication initiator protein DnaA [Deltaproteobacteria bacterium]MBI3390697.1 chromosomal replication initiator protein DnaA [Deltaproteobacteria bacterium]